MRLTLEGRLESNEELDVDDFENHALILNNIRRFEDLMSAIDLDATWAEVGELLESQSLLIKDTELGWFRRYRQPRKFAVPKKDEKRRARAELQNARASFLLACDDFWWGVRHQKIKSRDGEQVWQSEEGSRLGLQEVRPGTIEPRRRKKRAASSAGGRSYRNT
jgi:hypothetical protein